MPERSALVIGRGLAAKATALLLSARGWRTTVVGEDAARPWTPHILSDAAVRVLRAELPGLEEELLAAGARRHSVAMSLEQDFGAAAGLRPADHEVALLCCRGPLLLAAMRRRLEAAPAVALRAERVVGLLAEGRRIVGARTTSGELRADVVIDASGVGTRRRSWLAEAGLPADRVAAWGPGYRALTRYYRHDETAPLPFRLIARDGARGGLLPLDRGWFAVNFILPEPLAPESAAEAASLFERLADTVPGARRLMLQPASELTVTRGLMSAESDFYKTGSPAAALSGLYPLGDSLWTGNPIYARGFALSLLQGAALCRSLDAPRPEDALRAFRRELKPLRAFWRAGAFNELADAPVFSSPGALLARAARGYFCARARAAPAPRPRRPAPLRADVEDRRLPPHRVATARQHLDALLRR